MGKHAEEFLRQGVLFDAVVIIQPGLRPPADVEGGIDMGLAPLHDPADLRPVFHLLKGHGLHRRAGNNHAVKLSVLHLIEHLIELEKMLAGGVFGLVAGGVDEFQLHLQGRIPQQTG